jgi:hypothetical protein
VFLCGNHDLAFAAFVGALPPRPDGSTQWSDTWEEYAQNEVREGWYRGEGYSEMHVQGRRWGGSVGTDRYNSKKGMAYKGSIYDSAPTFKSYGVLHASSGECFPFSEFFSFKLHKEDMNLRVPIAWSGLLISYCYGSFLK